MPKGFLEQSGKRTTFRQITRKHLNCEVWVDISKMKKEKGTLKKKRNHKNPVGNKNRETDDVLVT